MAIDFANRGRNRPGFGNNPLAGLISNLINLPNHTGTPTPAAAPAPAPAPAVAPVTSSAEHLLPNATQNAMTGAQAQGLQNFYNSAAYQFPLQEGLDAVNSSYAGRGLLQSGAAQKAVENYGANAAAGGLNQYLAYLGNQQAVGATAASGMTGLAQNYANSMGNANSNLANAQAGAASNFGNAATGLTSGYAANIGNAYGNYGNALSQGAINAGNINSNSAIAHGNNTAGMINGIGSAFAGLGGAMAYRPYG
jgi:hypothetical protein